MANLTNLIMDNSLVNTQNEKEINVPKNYINSHYTPNRNSRNICIKTEDDQINVEHQNYLNNYQYQNYSSSNGKSKMSRITDENRQNTSPLTVSNQINANSISSKFGLNVNCGISTTKSYYNQEDTYGIKPQAESEQRPHLQKDSSVNIRTFQNIIPRRQNKTSNMVNVHSLVSSKGLEKDENMSMNTIGTTTGIGSEDTQNTFYSSNSKSHNCKYESSMTPAENDNKTNMYHEDANIEKFYSSGKIHQNFGMKINPNKLTKEQLTNIQFNNNIKYLEQSLRKKLDFSRESIQPDGLNRTTNYIDRSGNLQLYDPQSPDRDLVTQSLNMTTTNNNANNKGLLTLNNFNNYVSNPIESNLTPQNLCLDHDKVMNIILDLKNKVHEKDKEIIELKNHKIKYEMENQNLLIQIKNMIIENHKQETIDETKIQLVGKEKEFVSKRVKFQLNFQ